MQTTGDTNCIHVIFAKNESTYDEVFAGVAIDSADASRIAQVIDHDDISCWTELTELVQHQQAGLTQGQTVYVVFDGGHSQHSREVGWDPNTSPELLSAFADHAAAVRYADRLESSENSGPGPIHIWSVPLGWYDERLTPD